MTDAVSTEKTRILVVTYKARNGRRFDKEFPITEFQATDPVGRADAISVAAGYDNMVNWAIKE